MSATTFDPSAVEEPHGLRELVGTHPIAAYFVVAYAFSWLCWLPGVVSGVDAISGPAAVLIFVGVWGPAVAGALVTWLSGESVRTWARGLLRWRVPGRWYAFALGLPVALVAVASALFLAAGHDLDASLLPERLVAFLPMLVVLSLVGGGNEEIGWRGFALPRMLERWTPVRATLLLGVLWAVWHLPLLGAQDDLSHGLDGPMLALVLAATALTIVAWAFLYTYLYQRTRSALLCLLLHGAVNAANGTLVLRAGTIEGDAYAALQLIITAVLLVAVAAVVWATDGRLGARSRPVVDDEADDPLESLVVDLRDPPTRPLRERS